MKTEETKTAKEGETTTKAVDVTAEIQKVVKTRPWLKNINDHQSELSKMNEGSSKYFTKRNAAIVNIANRLKISETGL